MTVRANWNAVKALFVRRGEWSASQRQEWLSFAVSAGLDYVRLQTEELVQLRDRAVTFVAFIGAACAFLVAAAVSVEHRPWGFYAVAILGSVALSAMAVLVLLVIGATRKVRNVLSSAGLVGMMTGEKMKPTMEVARRHLAESTIPKMTAANETVLVRVRRLYNSLVVAGLAALIVWSAEIWVFA